MCFTLFIYHFLILPLNQAPWTLQEHECPSRIECSEIECAKALHWRFKSLQKETLVYTPL